MNVKEKGMQKKMFAALAAVVVAVIIAAALLLTLGRKEETYRSIKIIELEGGVTIEREGVGVLAASSNMNLISGDAVKTEQNAYAVLQLDSDKYVMLAESGSMTVIAEGDEANSRTAIQLDSGSVLNEIQNPLSDGSSYDIVTPNATMSVRGTVFEVRKNEDGNIEVLVFDGKVAVEPEGMEAALYEAGEYTQFTADQNPQFIVERAEISDENLNPQFMERLEQINSQSRGLNLGTAQLASAQGETAEPSPTPAVSEPEATPSRTAEPVQTATPKPTATPAATQAPVSTPGSQAGAGAQNVTTPTPAPEVPAVETPAVEPEDQDDDQDDEEDEDEDRSEADNSGSAQQPGGNTGSDGGNTGNGNNSGNTGNGNEGNTGNDNGNQGNGSWDINDKQNLWQKYTFKDYQQANPAAGTECTVIYYIPEIIEAVDVDGVRYSTLTKTSPAYTSEQAAAGSMLTKPADPEKEGFTFKGWCLEDGTEWDFTAMTVKADMCLYSLWSTADGDGTVQYFPVICRSEKQHCYYCNSVEKGSLLKEPTLSESGNPAFLGWKRFLGETDWDLDKEPVLKTESLKAFWSN